LTVVALGVVTLDVTDVLVVLALVLGPYEVLGGVWTKVLFLLLFLTAVSASLRLAALFTWAIDGEATIVYLLASWD
jgi:hypothetical protein